MTLSRANRQGVNRKMNWIKLKYFFAGSIACSMLFGSLFLIIVKSPKLVDGVMWRVERLQGGDSYRQRMIERFLHSIFLVQDESTPPGAIYLIGDSHLHLLPQHLTPWGINFAVGGQPMARIVDQIVQLPGLKRAGAVLVNGGENDLSYGASVDEIAEIWESLFIRNPDVTSFVCIGLPESFESRKNAENVKVLNKKIEQICLANGAPFVAVRMGSQEFLGHTLAIDHVHLTREAMVPFAGLLERKAKSRAGVN
jgi:hypothetical protein